MRRASLRTKPPSCALAGVKPAKAIAELGYSPRGLEQGLRDTLEVEGKLPAGA